MKNRLALSALILPLALMSFKDSSDSEKEIKLAGTYAAAKVKLSIKNDATFHYINHSDPDNKIDVKGNWEADGNTVILKNYQTSQRVPSKWKLDKKYPCLKSKMTGLEIIRLCQD